MPKHIKTFVTLEKVSLQLYSYFKKEASRGYLYQDISNPEKRVQHALGLSRTTFKRWLIDNGNETIPIREKRKKGRKFKLDSFDKDVVHRVISKCLQDCEVVTLRKLNHKLSRDHDMNICKATLWKCVRSLGFTFKKLKGGKIFVNKVKFQH